MRKFTLLFSILSTCFLSAFASHFKAGENIVVSTREYGDYYLAGDVVVSEAIIDGDFIAAGGDVAVEDTVFGDVIIGAGKVAIRGYVNDDVRVTGGEVTIDNIVNGDLIVFGGKVRITDRAMIMGDLVCFSGELSVYGDVKGNVRANSGTIRIKSTLNGNAELKGGAVHFDGHILGDATIAAETINIGKGAYCDGAVTYWSGDGEMDLSELTSNAVWDESLKMVDKNIDWSVLGMLLGVGLIAYIIIFIVSAFVILLLFEKLFSDTFHAASLALKESFIKSFGYGMIYFIGLPIVLILLFIMIIGIPIAVAGAAMYFGLLLFTSTISGLCLVHYIKNRKNLQWSYMQTVMYGLLTVVILKIIFILPILGGLIKLVVVGGSYGALLLVLLERRKAKS